MTSSSLIADAQLSAGDGADYQEWFFAGGDGFWQRGVGRFVGEIFLAGEEAEEGAALFADVIADGTLQHGIAGFEGVEDGALGDGGVDFDCDLVADVGEGAEVVGKFDADGGHGVLGLTDSA